MVVNRPTKWRIICAMPQTSLEANKGDTFYAYRGNELVAGLVYLNLLIYASNNESRRKQKKTFQ